MEDTPYLESWLFKHLVLDFPVDLTSALLNVECIPVTAAFGSHDHLASLVLESLELSRVFLEFEMPKFLLLLAFRVGVEDFKQILAFSYFPVSISMNNLSKVFHESEVCSHCIGQSSDLAQFRDQSYFIASLSVLVDEQRLIGFIDILVVSGLVVLLVRHL